MLTNNYAIVSCSLSAVQRGVENAPLSIKTRVCLLTLTIIINALRKNIYFLSQDINVTVIIEEYDQTLFVRILNLPTKTP